MNVLVSTQPFAANNKLPILLLKQNRINYFLNKKRRKFTKKELIEIIPKFEALICGTDIIDSEILNAASKLKIIARVGAGLNNLDLDLIKKKNIKVTHTPNIPSKSVAQFTVSLMISLLRKLTLSNNLIKRNFWLKQLGKNLNEAKIGIVGFGNIGIELIKILNFFECKNIYVNDININNKILKKYKLKNYSKEFIYKNSDIITFHIPLNKETFNLINKKELNMMNKNTILVNTSRGEIINEKYLFEFLKKKKIQAAALDVFAKEPYFGSLTKLDNCFCTSHIASMSEDCRNQMELESTKEIIRFFKKDKLRFEIPRY